MSDDLSSHRLGQQLAPGRPTAPPDRDTLWVRVQQERHRVRRLRTTTRVVPLAAAVLIAIAWGVRMSTPEGGSAGSAASSVPALTESLRVIDASLAAIDTTAGSERALDETKFLMEMRGRLIAESDAMSNSGGTE